MIEIKSVNKNKRNKGVMKELVAISEKYKDCPIVFFNAIKLSEKKGKHSISIPCKKTSVVIANCIFDLGEYTSEI